MARKSGRVLRGGRMVRETLWTGLSMSTDIIAAASTAVISASMGAGILALRPFTIVRTHLYLKTFSDQAAADERYGASIGLCVVSDQSVAIGVTAVPTPITDIDSDLWYTYADVYGFLRVTTDIGRLETGTEHRVDSKAMRKVEGGQDSVLVMETPASVSSGEVFSAMRQLIKLH